MVRLLTVQDIQSIVKTTGIEQCFSEVIDMLADDFSRWPEFRKVPRLAMHYPHGVFELMPTCDDHYFAYKYVNGHPFNPKDKKQTVVATGMLAAIEHGYPVLLSEMTLLTAIRTAATSALAARYLVREGGHTMAMIGTGSQSEFQVLAHYVEVGIRKVKYFDIDEKAMDKFADNLSGFDIECIRCQSGQEAIHGADIVTTATANKKQTQIINHEWIKPGVHINGVGGDCPGKTEIDPDLLSKSKIIVEFTEQTLIEGEIQNLKSADIHAELWELVVGRKKGRESQEEITFFDSVGFAIEDYSILKYFYQQAEKHNIGRLIDMVPSLQDPKDLFALLRPPQ